MRETFPADAEIIAVGSELLNSQRMDTDSLFLADQLNMLGVEVRRKLIVGDDRAILTDAVRGALARADIVIVTGGLGPTEDDLTREAVAAALDRALVFRQDLYDVIEERFRKRQRKMAEINKRQAFLVESADPLPNRHGTAAGQWIDVQHKIVMLLPGPPSELQPMFVKECLPRLLKRLPPQVIRTRIYRVAGMGESDVDDSIAPVYRQYTNPSTTILAAPWDIQVHLRARCATGEEADCLLGEVGQRIEALLGDRIFSRNGDSMEAVVGGFLRERGATLAVAESCTAGMIAERLTSVPGSSDYFLGGFFVYSDEMKRRILGVDPCILERHTAVSVETACAMADRARALTGAAYALSTTGEAGPQSATGAPPGTVYIGLAGPEGAPQARQFRLPGDRKLIRMFATQAALDLLRRNLLGSG
ncbi:MAG TPA: competence/damage-inducible protein A [Bryobacteraceae bacterium]|nr:competence/damage-inducible protein A [Bryobacteraceae bacterium]